MITNGNAQFNCYIDKLIRDSYANGRKAQASFNKANREASACAGGDVYACASR